MIKYIWIVLAAPQPLKTSFHGIWLAQNLAFRSACTPLPDGQGRRRLNKTKRNFAFVFVFDKFLTLDNENMLSLFSLNRNFALPLRRMGSKHLHNGISSRQRLFAWIMLSVYVPMVLLASLHVHSLQEYSKVVDCYECHTAVHHSGHIMASQHHHGECLSCRFLTTQVESPQMSVCSIIKQPVSRIEFPLATKLVRAMVAHPSLRAPPCIL